MINLYVIVVLYKIKSRISVGKKIDYSELARLNFLTDVSLVLAILGFIILIPYAIKRRHDLNRSG